MAPLLQMLLAQTRSEMLRRWRTPAFSLTNLVLPVLFFTFFGLPFARQTLPNGTSVGAYLLASFAAYAVGSVMVYGFGIGVAIERGMKVDVLMRATPLPPPWPSWPRCSTRSPSPSCPSWFSSCTASWWAGSGRTSRVWINIIVRLLAGSLPFIALGFAIGYGSGPNTAPPSRT